MTGLRRKKTTTRSATLFGLMLAAVFLGFSAHAEEKVYDFVILLDESGSMDRNDPYNVRRPACKRIIDKLKVSRQANCVAILKFATMIDEVHGKLTMDYDALYRVLDSGLTTTKQSKNYTFLDGCPNRGFTDTFAALEKAFEILSGSPLERNGLPVEKVVFLLTDGLTEPWPGMVGPIRDKYLKSVMNREYSGFCDYGKKGENPYCQEARNESRRLIIEDLLPRFKHNGFRIFAVGFGDADEDFLRLLSRGTLADYQKVRDFSEIDDLIDEYMPPIANEITIFSQRLCDSGSVDIPVTNNLEAIAITINFTRHIANLPVTGGNDIGLVITGSDGTKYDSTNGVSYRTPLDRENKKHYSHAYFHLENPPAGIWQVSLNPTGYRHFCGQVKAEARLNPPPSLTITPMDGGNFEVGAPLKITAWMEDQKGGIISVDRVDGRIETQSTVDGLHFRTSGGKHIAIYTPGAKGDYRVVVSYHLGQGMAKKEKIVTVRLQKPCTLVIQQEKDNGTDARSGVLTSRDGLNLGILGYPILTIKKTMVLQTEGCRKLVAVKFKPLIFSHEKVSTSKIPASWVKVSPSSSLAMDSRELMVSVSMGEDVPSNIVDGKYVGRLEISSPEIKEDYVIPVFFNLELPRIMLNGVFIEGDLKPKDFQDLLLFDFSSSLTKNFKKSLKLKITAGGKGEDVYYEIQGVSEKRFLEEIKPYFKFIADSTNGYIVERIQPVQNIDGYFEGIRARNGMSALAIRPLRLNLSISNPRYAMESSTDKMMSGFNIAAEEVQSLKINTEMPFRLVVNLDNQNSDESRIPAGLYTARLILSGSYLRTCYLPIKIVIPERTLREKWYRWLYGGRN